jgi:hypothetical protein
MAFLRCLLGLMLPAAVEALVDDLAHCTLEIRNGNIILVSAGKIKRWCQDHETWSSTNKSINVLEGTIDLPHASKVLIKNIGNTFHDLRG